MISAKKLNGRTAAILAAFAGSLLCAGFAVAQDKAPAPAPASAPTVKGQPAQPAVDPANIPADAPKLDFEELTHEFGVISDEKEVQTEFKFKNNGKSKLEITNLQGSCGCTVPALEKKTYDPGEEGKVKVIYNPHNRRGKQHTNVTVTSNDPAKAQIVLSVQSDVKPTIMTDPQVAAMGQVEKGKEGKATITITTRKADLLPTLVTPNDAKIEATLGEKKEAQVDGETVFQIPVELKLAATAEVGPIQTQCVVRTSDPNKTLNFMVLGEVVGMVKAEPQRVTLGGLLPGADMTTTVRLSPRQADKPFKVLGVEEAPASVPAPGNPQGAPGAKVFTIKFEQDSGATPPAWVITLTGKAPSESMTFRGDLIVKTDMAGEESVKIPYYGFIRQNKPRPTPAQNQGGQPSMLVPD